jgi:hypothetical protein
MAMPTGIGVIDLMLAIPTDDNSRWYEFMKPLLRDRESREQFKMPAQYMFRNIPGFRAPTFSRWSSARWTSGASNAR